MASDKRSILFFAKTPHNIAVYERVLQKLLADPRITLYLATKQTDARPNENLFEGFDLPGAKILHHRIARWKKFDLYLSPDIFLLGRRAKVKVHTFHGISIKGKAYTPKVRDYDKLFLIGEYQRRRFAEMGILEADDPRFVPIGMPKTDAFFDGSLDRESYLRERGLDPARKTILYAPTWRPESSLYSVGEELIRSMEGADYNFLVKLHDHSYTPAARIDWEARLADVRAPNVAILRESDITPTLHAADLLISDASSVANEFTLLDRPIVFIDVPELFEKYSDTIDRDGWGQRAGAVAKDVPEIHTEIEKALANPEERREIRNRIASEGFYNPGGATDAAVDAIGELLGLEPGSYRT